MNKPSWFAALLLLSACSTPVASEQAATTLTEQENEMMVIRVVVDVQESQVDAFVAHLREEAIAVRRMPGCERYELFRDPDNATRFMLYEEWATPEAFETYQASDLLRESFAVLGPMMAGPPDSSYFEATPRPQP
ncbi:MAG: putative quinol monooxygenase [Sandaracinaceae bacterium]